MWRIYSYGNKSLRIRAKTENLLKINDTEDAKKHIIALNNYLTKFENLNCKIENIASEIEKDLILLNLGKYKSTHKNIHVDLINNLIDGIMVNPFSPKWYIETVEEYCRINNITFDGVSQLYAK